MNYKINYKYTVLLGLILAPGGGVVYADPETEKAKDPKEEESPDSKFSAKIVISGAWDVLPHDPNEDITPAAIDKKGHEKQRDRFDFDRLGSATLKLTKKFLLGEKYLEGTVGVGFSSKKGGECKAGGSLKYGNWLLGVTDSLFKGGETPDTRTDMLGVAGGGAMCFRYGHEDAFSVKGLTLSIALEKAPIPKVYNKDAKEKEGKEEAEKKLINKIAKEIENRRTVGNKSGSAEGAAPEAAETTGKPTLEILKNAPALVPAIEYKGDRGSFRLSGIVRPLFYYKKDSELTEGLGALFTFGGHANGSWNIVKDKTKLIAGVSYGRGIGCYLSDLNGLGDKAYASVCEKTTNGEAGGELEIIKCCAFYCGITHNWTTKFSTALAASMLVNPSEKPCGEQKPEEAYKGGLVGAINFAYKPIDKWTIGIEYGHALRWNYANYFEFGEKAGHAGRVLVYTELSM